jgi:hypothetical protein
VPDGVVQSTSAVRDVITVQYDAATQSYTVETAGKSQTFAPGDAVAPRWPGEAVYIKPEARERLTLVTNPYFGAEFTNRYVGMGYWQSDASDTGRQQTSFSTFAYGLDTAASGMPRTGAAHWLTDIFGMYSVPGEELRIIQGLGDFEVDFAAGAFRANGYMDEYQVVTDGGAAGALTFQAGGELTSANRFSGLFSYDGHFPGVLLGTLSGAFYGPNAEEIGATFNASAGGANLTGALTGQRWPVGSTSQGITNISLTNVLANELLRGSPGGGVFATVYDAPAGFKQVTSGSAGAQVNLTLAGPSTVGFNQAYTPNPQEIVAGGNPNFTTYRATIAGAPTTIAYYKIGNANQELALTYTSFVSWSWPRGPGGSEAGEGAFQTQFATFGIQTPRDLLSGRTGTASYEGVAYGKGATLTGNVYDITGKSHFDVNFSAATYGGWLDLQGATSTGTLTNFGRFGFASTLAAGGMLQATLTGAVSPDGGSYIQPQFFGPSGQEIGAGFWLRIGEPGTSARLEAGGIAVAKAR